MLGCAQTGATTPNIVAPTMLEVVAFVLAVVCKRMQQLSTSLGLAVHRGKNTTHNTSFKKFKWSARGNRDLFNSLIYYTDAETPRLCLLTNSKFFNFRVFARIFQREGHTESNAGYLPDWHANIHAVFLLKVTFFLDRWAMRVAGGTSQLDGSGTKTANLVWPSFK